MHRARSKARRGNARRWAAAIFIIALAGCTSATNQVASSDPLFGDVQPRVATPTPVAPQQTQAPSAPPPATSRLNSTNAALASAGPLQGARPTLAINDSRTPSTPPNTGSQLAANTKPTQPTVMPLPKQDAPPTVFAPTGKGQPTTPAPANELELALKQRGVLFQKVDNVPQGVRFQCIVPSKQNRDVTRVFEATAPDYISAVRAVLKQIDEQK